MSWMNGLCYEEGKVKSLFYADDMVLLSPTRNWPHYCQKKWLRMNCSNPQLSFLADALQRGVGFYSTTCGSHSSF